MNQQIPYDRFRDRARKVVQCANQEAQRFNHEYIGTEHLLLGLVKVEQASPTGLFEKFGVSADQARQAIEPQLELGPDTILTGKLPMTPRARAVLEIALEEADEQIVDTPHLLLAMVREPDGMAGQALRRLGLEYHDAKEKVLTLVQRTIAQEAAKPSPKPSMQETSPGTYVLTVAVGADPVDTQRHLLRAFRQLCDGKTLVTITVVTKVQDST